MSAAAALGLAAGLTQAAAYLIYFAQVVREECLPNGMTWLMWSYGTFVFFTIELHLGVPISVLLLPAICMLCSIGVAGYAFARGVHLRPERHDWGVLAFDAALLLGYAGFVLAAPAGGGAVEAAGLVFAALPGVSAVSSSWPALRATFRDPVAERPLAWFVWSAAYGLLALAAMAEGLAWPFLVYPILSQAIAMLIGLLALDGESPPVRATAAAGDPGAGTTQLIA